MKADDLVVATVSPVKSVGHQNLDSPRQNIRPWAVTVGRPAEEMNIYNRTCKTKLTF